jgi:general secretion pathway protein G
MCRLFLHLLVAACTFVCGAASTLPFRLYEHTQKAVRQAREDTLRHDLFEMRGTIDRYAADKGRLPSSLNELVRDGYLRSVPLDPMTEKRDWAIVEGEYPVLVEETVGVKDVRSASRRTGLDGTSYDTW